LVGLAWMSLIELMVLRRAFQLMSLGNIVGGGLWVFALRGGIRKETTL